MSMLRMTLACWTFLGWMIGVSQGQDTVPNVVIIYADDMGYGDLSIQNPEAGFSTPNLDRLAGQGLRFTDAHSSSGICTPSRYALLTGRYHWRRMHEIAPVWGGTVFEDDRLTLPQMLKQQGYRTACIGKWHLGFDWSAIRNPEVQPDRVGRQQIMPPAAFDWSKPIPGGPLDHGFDYYFGDDVPNYPPYAWIENDRILTPPTVGYVPDPQPTEGSPEGRPGPMVAGWKQDQVMPTLTARAIRWIEQQKGKTQPFFLYWAWTSPHAPIVPIQQWQGRSVVGGYGDYMLQSDAMLGQVLQALQQHGFQENTLVIFTSDNGPESYAYQRRREHGHSSSGPLRGLKRDLYEGGHRVPMVIRWPGVVEPGTETDQLFSQIDIMATLAAVTGYSLPPGAAEDSQNQLSLWKGGSSARTTLVHNTKRDHYATRSGQWLLIDSGSGAISQEPKWYTEQYELSESKDGALFDLKQDLGQRVDLKDQHPEIVARLRSELREIRTDTSRGRKAGPGQN